MKTHREIAAAVRGIEKERVAEIRERMRDFDQSYYYPRLNDISVACGVLGHDWRFTGLSSLGDPWFRCYVCHTSECRRENDDGEE